MVARPSRKIPGQPDSARPCIGRPLAFQSPKNEKDYSEPLDIPKRAGRWYVVGYSGRNSHEPKTICEIRATLTALVNVAWGSQKFTVVQWFWDRIRRIFELIRVIDQDLW